MKRKLLAIILSLCLVMGTTGSLAVADANSALPTAGNYELAYNSNTYYQYGGPVDLNIADEDKVIEMLKKEGKIDPKASYEEARAAFVKYMQEAAKANMQERPSKWESDLKAKQRQKVQKYVFEKQATDPNPMRVNVLVLLADFSDYKRNSIQPGETNMYYSNYTHEHFENMIFGDNGYVGPNGEKFVSMKQYYLEQSGGSLIIEGKVAGWYTLPQTAAYYGAPYGSSNDIRPRNAVAHALQLAAMDPNINFADFDKTDRYDLDGDGNVNEPDGIIDHLMVIHAGVGQEAGGGSLGSNAIWSHRWNLGYGYPTENGFYKIPGSNYYAYDYTMEPEDGAAGVFAHEFGHDLGLPDEYDTQYSAPSGEPISMWSIMSSGSWAGKIGGTEPTGFSPYAREFFQAVYGGNWQKAINIDYDKITSAGARVTLRQASEAGQVVRINLPGKPRDLGMSPLNGKYSYWGGRGENLDNSMFTKVTIPNAADVKMTFKTWYEIEEDWDYASVIIREAGTTNWTTLAGNITTVDDPNHQNPGNGITGSSDGWIDANFNMTAYAGKTVEIGFNYWTDGYVTEFGFLLDDIVITADATTVFTDGGEVGNVFTMNGFIKTDGTYATPHYYLVEWRNHHGVDKGLANIAALDQIYSYAPGMVVWYVDPYFGRDNWRGNHPGEGFLGVIDADQESIMWTFADGKTASFAASGRYQMRDAAFNKDKEAAMNVNLTSVYGRYAEDTNRFTEPSFDDSKDFSNVQIPTLGTKLISYGIKIQITNQAKDNSEATITIKK